MKKLIVLAVVMLLGLSLTAIASDTGRGDYTTPIVPVTTWLNENDCIYHSHEYSQTSKYKSPLGYMLDVTLYEVDALGIPCALGLQGTYDQNNAVWGAYAKVSINLSPLIKGLIGIE